MFHPFLLRDATSQSRRSNRLKTRAAQTDAPSSRRPRDFRDDTRRGYERSSRALPSRAPRTRRRARRRRARTAAAAAGIGAAMPRDATATTARHRVKQRGLVQKEIASASFSFYDAEDVRKISVKRITNPVLFDGLNNAVADGLYDPALGPTDSKTTCVTCKFPGGMCAGHFGHLELVVPVYNPLTFGTVVRLLKTTCFHCHKFRLHASRVRRFRERLEMLMDGDMEAAEGVLPEISKKAKEEMSSVFKEVEGDGDAEEMDLDNIHDVLPRLKTRGRGEPVVWTSITSTAARNLIKEFLAIQPKKCENCGAMNPKVSPEGHNKIFRGALPKAHHENNLAKGIDINDDMAYLAREASAESADSHAGATKLAGAAVEPKLVPAKKKARKRLGEGDESDRSTDDEGAAEKSSEARDVDAQSDSSDDSDSSDSETMSVDERVQETAKSLYITPIEARALLKRLWMYEYDFCSMIWATNPPNKCTKRGEERRSDPARFFIQTLLVAPSKFRPPSKMGDMIFDHPQNTALTTIIQANLSLAELFRTPPTVPEPPEVRAGRAVRAWLALQSGVNRLIDATKADTQEAKQAIGIRQQLEKKEGLFRMNMMGKRVNFAARSVISPDPYLGTSEIGVPPVFAKKLTFPELVTPHNVDLMRTLVENGPEIHPGANAIEDERGRVIHLDKFTAEKRAAIAKTLLATTAAGSADGPARPLAKTVYRHLRDGDVMLVNRQPTLHKPGILAHTARVLPGQRVVRMHYSNCSTFNADFDGDEINLHFPQDHLGRAEAYEIMHGDRQFTVPTDGKPLRGLIQDHICSGLLLSMRDSFFDRSEFTQLLYSGLVDYCGDEHGKIDVPAPALLKPKALWTGKQVIAAVLSHITRGRPPLTFSAPCKIPATFFGGEDSGEDRLIIRRNYFCSGVVDKNMFGKYGLVHAVAELHGRSTAGALLSIFSRLFTNFLQKHGFTCGIDDLILTADAEKDRVVELNKADEMCKTATADVAEASGKSDEEVMTAIAAKLLENPEWGAQLDMKASGALNKVTSATVKKCLPFGTKKPFSKNCLSIMTISGAKGSLVNFSQIAAALGQQELEGRRVPRMPSGKTLPSFEPFDISSRANGYIACRFFSGLDPAEYFFHCMAGREGLVDTAVKTARSGYLQRCLVKNLESLRVHYDFTVRDSDGSIVQFQYGEDCVDVTRSGYLEKFEFLAENPELILLNNEAAISMLPKLNKKKVSVLETIGRKEELPRFCMENFGDQLGVLPEKFGDELKTFIDSRPKGYWAEEKGKKNESSLAAKSGLTAEEFAMLMNMRYLTYVAPPGEAVGVIAAQSVGEPSTQMTLNTFHFAGRGEANVTLGIPRLRELLMAASKKLLTPVMILPLKPGCRTKENAETLCRRLRRVILAELITKLCIKVKDYGIGPDEGLSRLYTVVIQMREGQNDDDPNEVTFAEFLHAVKRKFAKMLVARIGSDMRKSKSNNGVIVKNAKNGPMQGTTDPRKDDDEEEDDEKEKNSAARAKNVKFENGDASDEDEDDEEDEEGAKTENRKIDETEVDSDSDGSSSSGDDDSDASLDDSAKTPKSKKKRVPSSEMTDCGVQLTEDEVVETIVCDEKSRTIEFTVPAGINSPHVLVLEIAQEVAVKTIIRETPGIKQTFVVGKTDDEDPTGSQPLSIQTDGINFGAAWANSDLIEVNSMKSNSVWDIMQTFGVEAGRSTLVSEVQAVFGVYGIGVDTRHLSLIGDFMTQQGEYRPCNRSGIEKSTSPFLKMSYETATAFLTDATIRGETDDLSSPSSRIVVGRTVDLGTGSFSLKHDIVRAAQYQEANKATGKHIRL